MGLKQLLEYRTYLTRILGGRIFTTPELDSWTNTGYYDLTGAIDFPELRDIGTDSIVADDISVALPASTQVMRVVVDDTNKVGLLEDDETEFILRDVAITGDPTNWCVIGNLIRLWPKATSATVDLRFLFNKYPTALSGDTDVTVLSPTWDRAIELLSASHALFDLGEEVRSNDYLAKAMNYIRSRILADELRFDGPSVGVGMATSLSDITGLRS